MHINPTSHDVADATREYNAMTAQTQSRYPVGSRWSTPNGEAQVVAVDLSAVTLRLLSTGAQQTLDAVILDHAVKTSQFVRQ